MSDFLRELVVAGDVTVDWNLARVSDPDGGRAWTAEAHFCAHSQAGGAALLTRVLVAVADQLDLRGVATTVRGPVVDTDHIVPGDPRFPHAYALWSRFDDGAWRVQEFLGIEKPPDGTAAMVAGDADPATAHVVVLDDGAFGMRGDPTR